MQKQLLTSLLSCFIDVAMGSTMSCFAEKDVVEQLLNVLTEVEEETTGGAVCT